MRAAVITAPGRIEISDVPVPEPGPGQVRVRLEGCGICGSNLPVWEGRPWFSYPFEPGAPGHEGWGVVDAIGPRAGDGTPCQVGRRVAVLSYNAFAEYDLAAQDAVVPLDPSLNKKPFPGEALGCAMNVFARCDIQPGQTVAIIGIGFLGALLTQLAAKAGAQVIAIGRRPAALEIAQHFGAWKTIRLDQPDRVLTQAKTLTGGLGCERVIEVVGLQAPLDLAGELTRERGRLIIAGYHQDGLRQVNMQLWNWRGLDVINAHERDPQVYVKGIRAAVEAVASGRLDPTPLYTHRCGLDQIGEGFNALRDRPKNFFKALIQL